MYFTTWIEHKISDLEYHRFEFIVIDKQLKLDTYSHMTRESKRHKFVRAASYSRLNTRSHRLEYDDVPFELIPGFVTQVKQQLMDSITFVKND